MLYRNYVLPLAAIVLAACEAQLPSVVASIETAPVESTGDAADDPAIWVNPTDPAASLILATDKKSGLYAYDLSGAVTQFLSIGRLNNVDLRQGVSIDGWSGDIAAASNRSDDTVSLFSIAADGRVELMGAFPSSLAEPYGLCLGTSKGAVYVFVAHKTGDLLAYQLGGEGIAQLAWQEKFESQLEGCVFDDASDTLYLGEEEHGIWKLSLSKNGFASPVLLDTIGGAGGLVADVEGLTLYKPTSAEGYLIASSQGDNSYVIYDLSNDQPPGKFSVAAGATIDGTEETDGIAASATPFGGAFL